MLTSVADPRSYFSIVRIVYSLRFVLHLRCSFFLQSWLRSTESGMSSSLRCFTLRNIGINRARECWNLCTFARATWSFDKFIYGLLLSGYRRHILLIVGTTCIRSLGWKEDSKSSISSVSSLGIKDQGSWIRCTRISLSYILANQPASPLSPSSSFALLPQLCVTLKFRGAACPGA